MSHIVFNCTIILQLINDDDDDDDDDDDMHNFLWCHVVMISHPRKIVRKTAPTFSTHCDAKLPMAYYIVVREISV